jgi:hypothetical protein
MSPRERALVGDVQRALLTHRPLVVREFVRALTEQRAAASSTQEESTRNAPPSGLGGLSLVDETQVEVDVEVSRAIEAIRSVAEYEMRELMTYTSALVGDMDVARDYNPLRPEVHRPLDVGSRAGTAAAAALPAGLHAHACMPLAQLVRKAYAGACARLESMGVEPAVYRTIIVFGSRRGKGQQDAFFDPQANRAEQSTPLPGPSRPPAAANPRRRQPPPPHRRARGCRWNRCWRAPTSCCATCPKATATSASACATCSSQQMLASAEKAADRELIDLLGRLFDTVLGDRRLARHPEPGVAPAGAGAAAVAARPGHAGQLHHPVWLLMDRIALQGELHPPPGDPERTRMLRFMHGLLDTLAQEQARDADAFRWARERVPPTNARASSSAAGRPKPNCTACSRWKTRSWPAARRPPARARSTSASSTPCPPTCWTTWWPPALRKATRPTTARSGWMNSRRSGEWVHMFMQGAWVNAQLLWYGRNREYWLFGDGASANTWAIRRGASSACCRCSLLTTLVPRSLIRDAAGRVLQQPGELTTSAAGTDAAGGTHWRSASAASPRPWRDSAENSVMPMSACSPASVGQHVLGRASALSASRRLSLSALVSSTSSRTSPVATRGAISSSSWRSRSVKPRRESTICTTPCRLRRTTR